LSIGSSLLAVLGAPAGPSFTKEFSASKGSAELLGIAPESSRRAAVTTDLLLKQIHSNGLV
jgi:hypothetical protein